VFDQIHGLPVHALVLHVAVVFVPLLALGAIVYAVAPKTRPRIGWAVAALAVVTPITCFVTKESGEKLYDRTIANGMRGKALAELNKHMSFGTDTFWWVLALGVVTLVMLVLTWGSRSLPMIASAAGSVVMVVLAVVAGYYVYRTGDTGATVVWNPQG
jgi:peptidoglycan/LPS O-acetylase OafA/YrhL